MKCFLSFLLYLFHSTFCKFLKSLTLHFWEQILQHQLYLFGALLHQMSWTAIATSKTLWGFFLVCFDGCQGLSLRFTTSFTSPVEKYFVCLFFRSKDGALMFPGPSPWSILTLCCQPRMRNIWHAVVKNLPSLLSCSLGYPTVSCTGDPVRQVTVLFNMKSMSMKKNTSSKML